MKTYKRRFGVRGGLANRAGAAAFMLALGCSSLSIKAEGAEPSNESSPVLAPQDGGPREALISPLFCHSYRQECLVGWDSPLPLGEEGIQTCTVCAYGGLTSTVCAPCEPRPPREVLPAISSY